MKWYKTSWGGWTAVAGKNTWLIRKGTPARAIRVYRSACCRKGKGRPLYWLYRNGSRVYGDATVLGSVKEAKACAEKLEQEYQAAEARQHERDSNEATDEALRIAGHLEET